MEFQPRLKIKLNEEEEVLKGRIAKMFLELLKRRRLIEQAPKGRVTLHFAGTRVSVEVTIKNS